LYIVIMDHPQPELVEACAELEGIVAAKDFVLDEVSPYLPNE